MTEDRDTPACPVCSRELVFCNPSHEKSYWACRVDHDPPGVVLLADEIGYAFAHAALRVVDYFEQGDVECFADVETPADAIGVLSRRAVEGLDATYGFKQQRQRWGHDDLGVDDAASDAEQSGLGRWSA